MNAYFSIILGLYLLSLGATLAEHGKPKTGNHSFWGTLFGSTSMIVLMYFAIKQGF